MGSRLNSESLDSSRSRSFETRSLPSFDSCAPAQFELSVLPIYVARAPRGSILAATHRGFALITRMAPSSRQLPSCVAVYPRDSRSRRVLCRFPQTLHSLTRDVFYVAFPKCSIRSLGLPIYVARFPSASFAEVANDVKRSQI